MTGILPWLTPLVAIGFAIIQVLAIVPSDGSTKPMDSSGSACATACR